MNLWKLFDLTALAYVVIFLLALEISQCGN